MKYSDINTRTPEAFWPILGEFYHSLPKDFPIRRNNSWSDIKALIRELHRADELYGYVAFTKEGEPVGVFLVEVGYDAWADEKLAIEVGLYVSPEYRGRGIPEDLVRMTCEALAEDEIDRIDVGVTLAGDRAVCKKLYEEQGFTFSSVSYTKELQNVQEIG